ncbi:O-antigen ligase family protein [Polaromonas glacialis]|uniref:O-antigen ligase family protein n=1 Tax=Polaromonas glacialis TaxID=866564 RepID=UPI0012EC905D|nr:O-antigen ligase family protein [Polaromonas glacialis]
MVILKYNVENIAHLAFILLFPGFFFYQTLIGLGILPPIIGGYFSPVSSIFFLILIFFYIKKVLSKRNLISFGDIFFILFIIYFILIVVINFGLGANTKIVQNHVLSIVQLVVIFLVFRFSDFGSNKFFIKNIISILIMSAIVFYFSDQGVFFLRSQNETDENEALASYQGFARSLFVTVIVVLPFLKKNIISAALICISIFALYINGARSELAATIFAVVLFLLVSSRRKVAIFTLGMIFLGLLAFYENNLIELLPNNRSLQLLDATGSTSWVARQGFLLSALASISENPIFGDYGSYARTGEIGSYAHNIMSAWVDLGIIGFILLVFSLLYPVVILSRYIFFTRKKSEEMLLVFVLFVSTTFLLIGAKNFTYMLTGAALGAYARFGSSNFQSKFSTRAVPGINLS